MGRVINSKEFTNFIDNILAQAVDTAREQPVMRKRQSGCVLAVLRPHTEMGNYWLTDRFAIAPYPLGIWQRPVFGEDLCIVNGRGEFCSTLGIAIAKIASCEQAVLRGKGTYSGIIDEDLPTDTENGFTFYPGACCYTIYCPEDTEPRILSDGKYQRDLTGVVADLFLACSGGTGIEDLTTALSPGVKIMNFFGHYGYRIKHLSEPPVEVPKGTIIL